MKETLWMLRYWRRQFAPQRLLGRWCRDIAAWRRFWGAYYRYQQLASNSDKQPLLEHLYPCLGDDSLETPIEPIYFYQDTWAFEKIFNQKPNQHIDVGSHHKFVAFLSKVMPVIMVDIRPLPLPLDTLTFKQGSILDLPFADGSIESLSSLCVVEHIGLGRYGDLLDPNGTEKAISELKRVIKPNGHLYLSLPIDDENRTFFNAHRTLTEEYIEKLIFPFSFLEKTYIYGKQLCLRKKVGFGIGLYHLKNTVS